MYVREDRNGHLRHVKVHLLWRWTNIKQVSVARSKGRQESALGEWGLYVVIPEANVFRNDIGITALNFKILQCCS